MSLVQRLHEAHLVAIICLTLWLELKYVFLVLRVYRDVEQLAILKHVISEQSRAVCFGVQQLKFCSQIMDCFFRQDIEKAFTDSCVRVYLQNLTQILRHMVNHEIRRRRD